MMDLIDQSIAGRLRYRCGDCNIVVVVPSNNVAEMHHCNPDKDPLREKTWSKFAQYEAPVAAAEPAPVRRGRKSKGSDAE